MLINRQKATSIPAGLGLSLAINTAITTIMIILIAVMVDHGTITWESVGYWIMSMLLISSFIGAKTAIHSIKTQYLLIAAMSGVLYWTVLLCVTALFFGGKYGSVMETAALIVAGSITAALIKLPAKRSFSPKKQYTYR